MQFWHSRHVELRHKIIFIAEVAHGPNDACGRGLASRFVPNLCQPFDAVVVFDVELGGRSSQVFLHKFIRGTFSRGMPTSALTKGEIQRRNVDWIVPKSSDINRLNCHRMRTVRLCQMLRGRDSVPGGNYRSNGKQNRGCELRPSWKAIHRNSGGTG